MTHKALSKLRKIGFVHLGCPKNLVDTETMLGLLREAGYQIVADEKDADLMLVNSCSFIEKAQEESVKNIVHLASQGKSIVITGCLAQKYREELLELIPEAEAVVGTADIANITDVIEKIGSGEKVVSVTDNPDYILESDAKRMHITMGPYVYLKITEGCDWKCSFCIIPSLRGAFRSRSMESILKDARRFAEKGVSELILIGQDTTSYGKESGLSLSLLLRLLNEIEGLQWIRFMYAYPNLVNDELLEAIAECDKVVKYIDCPLQHTEPEILKRMRRPVMDQFGFVEKIRDKVPRVKIRTSLIVGFPGETEGHFESMLENVKNIGFDRLGLFEYSDIEGAYSRKLDGKVSKREIKRRYKTLMTMQMDISLEKNRALIGETLDVLVDMSGPGKNSFTGRTQWDAPEIDNRVIIKGMATPGEIVPVKVESVTPYDLIGSVVKYES